LRFAYESTLVLVGAVEDDVEGEAGLAREQQLVALESAVGRASAPGPACQQGLDRPEQLPEVGQEQVEPASGLGFVAARLPSVVGQLDDGRSDPHATAGAVAGNHPLAGSRAVAALGCTTSQPNTPDTPGTAPQWLRSASRMSLAVAAPELSTAPPSSRWKVLPARRKVAAGLT
jgi:hypothetical protein